MSFNIIATPQFKKEIKRLAKKYNSLKNEYAHLIESYRRILITALTLAIIAIKYAWLFLQKIKGKVVVQG